MRKGDNMPCGLYEHENIKNGHENHLCVECGKPIPCPVYYECSEGKKCLWEKLQS